MDKSINTGIDFSKSTEGNDSYDFTINNIVYLEFVFNLFPGIVFSFFEAKRNLAAFFIKAYDINFNFAFLQTKQFILLLRENMLLV